MRLSSSVGWFARQALKSKTRRASLKQCRARWRRRKRSAWTGKDERYVDSSSGTDMDSSCAISSRV